jgi:hypothetical protein
MASQSKRSHCQKTIITNHPTPWSSSNVYPINAHKVYDTCSISMLSVQDTKSHHQNAHLKITFPLLHWTKSQNGHELKNV